MVILAKDSNADSNTALNPRFVRRIRISHMEKRGSSTGERLWSVIAVDDAGEVWQLSGFTTEEAARAIFDRAIQDLSHDRA